MKTNILSWIGLIFFSGVIIFFTRSISLAFIFLALFLIMFLFDYFKFRKEKEKLKLGLELNSSVSDKELFKSVPPVIKRIITILFIIILPFIVLVSLVYFLVSQMAG